MSNPQEFKKVEWLKVEFNNKVKRVFNPSKDLLCLSNQVKTHFKELNECLLVNSEELELNEFAIIWVTQDQQRIVISDSDQLEEIYMMHCVVQETSIPINEGQKSTSTLRFQVIAKLQEDLYKSVFSLAQDQHFNRNEEEKKIGLNDYNNQAINPSENMKQSLFYSSHDSNMKINNDQPRVRSESLQGKKQVDDDIKASTFKSCHPSHSSLQREKESHDQNNNNNSQSNLQSGISDNMLDEIQSQKSEDVNQDYGMNDRLSQNSSSNSDVVVRKHSQSSDSDYDSSEDEDLEDIRILQTLKHRIRLEVEKSLIQLFESEPKLEAIKLEEIKQQEIEQVENQAEEEKIENSQLIDISVSISNKPVNPLSQSQKFLSGLQSFRNFFNKKNIPKDKQLYAMIQGQSEIYLEAEADQQCTLKWVIQNQAQIEWPKGIIQLVPVYSQPVVLINVKDLQATLKPNETEEIQINLFIPKDIKETYQIVMFRLRTQDRQYLGQPLIAFIKVKRDQNSSQDSKDENCDSQLQYSRVSLRKSSIDDFTLYNLNDEQLLGMASLLFDEGYGSFDRCYGLIRVLRGDLKKARDILSQLIFYECQY
eukprot:403360863